MCRSIVSTTVVGDVLGLLPVRLEPLLKLRDLARALDLDVQLDVLGQAGRVKLLEPTRAWDPTTSSLAWVM